jgi:NAD(P)-dependent dehydrogenase (short-subunit alcohol dehydrogenase family)
MSSRNIVLVGASSGIGADLLGKLESNGDRVFTLGRNDVSSAGHLYFDAKSAEEIQIPGNWPEVVHGLVYCPGTIQLKPIQRLSLEDFRQDFEVNVLGFVQVLKAFLPRLKKSGSASIVTYSTVATRVGLGFHASVAASKSALEGLCLSLASELAPSGIRVNVVAPSLTQTPLASGLLNTPEKLEASAKRHPLARVGNTNDMSAAAMFLLSTDSSWITGQILSVDGGMSKLK